MFPTPIAVGVDGSPAAQLALTAGVELARATGSPLHLVHVRSTSRAIHGRTPPEPQRTRSRDDGDQVLDDAAQQVTTLGGEVAATHLHAATNLARGLAEAATQLEVGLLVVGAGRSGRLVELVTTDASASTVRAASMSVLVVR